jgi:phosphoribosylformylglycinamidine synthase subunit PurQ / glutaminase
MRKPLVFILWMPGVNCHLETKYAFEKVGANVRIVTIFQVIRGKVNLLDCDILVLAGGFSWGDHIRAGVIAAMDFIFRLRPVFQVMLDQDRPIIGICNGFQDLAHSGLLDRNLGNPTFLLDRNLSGNYEHLKVRVFIHHHPGCVWTEGLDGMELEEVTAFGEGCKVILAPEDQCTWKVAATYGSLEGVSDYPRSPCGDSAAAICNRNVFGWFPHGERRLDDYYPVYENGVRAVR